MCNQVVRVAISRKGQGPVGFVHFANRSVSGYHYSEFSGTYVLGYSLNSCIGLIAIKNYILSITGS